MQLYPSAVMALVWKDFIAESRTRESIAGGIVFALLSLVIFNFAFDLRSDNMASLAPGVLWMVFIFAGLLGIGRGFAREVDRGTLDGLLLAPIDRSAIYLAGLCTNTLLMGFVELVSLPVFVALFNVQFDAVELVAVLFLGTLGFTGVGTLCAAIAAATRARELVLPLLLLPLEVPVVIASVQATANALSGPALETIPWLQLLLGFDVILVACAVLVFEYIVEQ